MFNNKTSIVDKLSSGAVSFREKDFETHKGLFGDLSKAKTSYTFYWMFGFSFGPFAYNFHHSGRAVYNTQRCKHHPPYKKE